jgi:hypothetical protein
MDRIGGYRRARAGAGSGADLSRLLSVLRYDTHVTPSGEVEYSGRAIVAEHDHRDALAAVLLVVGIVAHEGAAVDEPGDMLVTRDVGRHHKLDDPRAVRHASDAWLPALDHGPYDRVKGGAVSQTDRRPERGRDLI